MPGNTHLNSIDHTPQARDDMTVGGENAPFLIDVLANDGGGSAKRLHSVDQAQLTSPIPLGASSAGAIVSIAGDEILYDPGEVWNHLAAGETAEDTFTYSIRLGNGAISTATVSVTITGINDAATINGDNAGDVKEDQTLIASGSLTVNDADNGEAELIPIADAAGTYGTFDVQSDGQWTYTLDNSNSLVQSLNDGDTLTDSIEVTSKDGTATETITVTIAGTNDTTLIVLDFEDMNPVPGFSNTWYVLDGYHGFDFEAPSRPNDDAFVVGETAGFLDLGVAFSSGAGNQYVWNNGSAKPLIISRSDGADFDFESGYFIARFQSLTLNFQGYKDGVLVETHSAFLPIGQEVFVQVGWNEIDSLVLNYSGFNIAMDNLTFYANA